MPVQKAAYKDLRQSIQRGARNRKWQSDVDALVRRVRQAIAAGDQAKAKEWLRAAIRRIDRAAQKGALKRNTASRKKSRLVRLVQRGAKQ